MQIDYTGGLVCLQRRLDIHYNDMIFTIMTRKPQKDNISIAAQLQYSNFAVPVDWLFSAKSNSEKSYPFVFCFTDNNY